MRETATDLTNGAWLVEITFGRVGSPGRRLCYIAGDEAEAWELVQRSLRRCTTAKRRIGVP